MRDAASLRARRRCFRKRFARTPRRQVQRRANAFGAGSGPLDVRQARQATTRPFRPVPANSAYNTSAFGGRVAKMGLLDDGAGIGSGRDGIGRLVSDVVGDIGAAVSSLLEGLLGFVSAPGGAALVGTAAAAAATYRWWKLPLLGLFARILGARVLDQPTRARIYELVRERPGIRAHHIAKTLDLAGGQAAHHLRTLVREGLVIRTRRPLPNRYFVKGSLSPNAMASLTANQSPSMAGLRACVESRPGATISEAAASLGLSVGRVSRMARTLRDAGLVLWVPAGRTVQLFPPA